MLEARGLCKSYGDRAVVTELSLVVAAGEIVGLLGPNGAGKSTTVAMLCGLVGADRGEVFVGTGASRLALDENAHAAKRRIGVVPQELSIYENLETLRDRGKALLYTTHYMEEAERLCDRVIIMDHGRVVASDTLAGLYQRLPAVETLELEVEGTVDLAALGAATGVTRPTQ